VVGVEEILEVNAAAGFNENTDMSDKRERSF